MNRPDGIKLGMSRMWLNWIEGIMAAVDERAAALGYHAEETVYITSWPGATYRVRGIWEDSERICASVEGCPLYNYNRVRRCAWAISEVLKLHNDVRPQFIYTAELPYYRLYRADLEAVERLAADAAMKMDRIDMANKESRRRAGRAAAGDKRGGRLV